MAELAPLRRRLDQHMSDHSLKQTRQRQIIFEIFAASDDHVAVDELLSRVQREMPGVGYATVYRALRLFLDAGVAQERHFSDGQTRYEPAQVDQHHDHLICNQCGQIFEFEDELIEERQTQVATQHGFSLASHRHEIYGDCTRPDPCPYKVAQASRAR